MSPPDPSKSELNEEVRVKLEALDDVIFPAIEGDLQALEASEQAWKATLAEVGVAAIAETRCEYLRYARSTWRLLKSQTMGNPLRVLAVLRIIAMLVGEDV
jgi:hypothetical protein